MAFSLAEYDNFPHYDKVEPFFESWIFLLDLLDSDKALWLEYQTLYPQKTPAQACIYAQVFDLESQTNFNWQEDNPLDFFRSSHKFFFIQIGKSWLKQNSVYGDLNHSEHGRLSWDLEFEPNLKGTRLLPPLLQASPWPPLKQTTPQPQLCCYGEISYQNQRYHIDQEPAMQAHHWGRYLPQKNFWAFCNTFLESDDAILEIGFSRSSSFLPGFTSLCLSLEGKHYDFCGYRALLTNRLKKSGSLHWTFYAKHHGLRLTGEIEVEPEFVAPKPFSTQNYTKLGNITLTLSQKIKGSWVEIHHLSAGQSCAITWTKTRG